MKLVAATVRFFFGTPEGSQTVQTCCIDLTRTIIRIIQRLIRMMAHVGV